MGRPEFRQLVNHLLDTHPHPPRTYPRRWLRHILFDIVACSLYLFGIGVGSAMLWSFYRDTPAFGPTGPYAGVFWGFTVLFGSIAAFPIIGAWLRDYAIRHGRIGMAAIIRTTTTGQRIRAYCEVMVDQHHFTTSFTGAEGTWMNDMRPGQTIRVLVHPRKPTIIMIDGW